MLNSEELVAAAIRYAEMGWLVLPLHSVNTEGACSCGNLNCEHPGKHPLGSLVPNGLKDATKDTTIIKKWWTEYPLSNIGVVMGETSGIFSIDIDGPEGIQFLADKEIPNTISFKTGRGKQIIFKYPKGASIRSRVEIVEDIDIRGTGSYSVLPPSRHYLGTGYEWILSPQETEPASPPEWLLHWLESDKKRGIANKVKLPDVIPSGARDSTLASIAGSLRQQGAEEPEIFKHLLGINLERCQPPLEELEIKKIAHSISRYEPGKIISPEENLNNLQIDPANKTLLNQFFDSLITLSNIDQKRYLSQALNTIFAADGVTISDLKKDFKRYRQNTIKDKSSFNIFFDLISRIKFELGDDFLMDDNGVFLNSKGIFLTRKPLFVTEILKDIITNEYYVRLVSFKNSMRLGKIVSQKDISDKKLLGNLSQFGFPVTSHTSGETVAFLNDLIYRNENRIPIGLASSQLGWQGDSFLFPDIALQKDGSEIPVHFVHDEPSARMFASKGDKETYLNLIRGLKADLPESYVIPVFVIYATLASFLLEPMDSPNLVINFCFESGEGKTTILKLCGSVFGNPGKCYVTWDATDTFIGRRAAILNGIPLLINESSSKASVKKGELSKTVYMLSEGRTRGKANPDSGMSTAPILEFRSVTFSCGEISLLADSDLVGAQIRLVEFETAFGVIDVDFIQKLENVIKDNYGLLGKEFIKKVMETDLSKFKLFRTIDPNNCTPKQKSKINHLNRKIKQLQPVFVAGLIAESLFNFGYDPLEIVGKVYDEIEIKILKNIGTVDQFVPWLHDFIAQNPDRFPAEIELLSGTKHHSGPVWGMTRGLDLFGY